MAERTDRKTGEHVEALSTTQARQAVAPHRLRYVLGFGILGVVVAFAIIYAAFVGW